MISSFHSPDTANQKEFIESLKDEKDISFAINCFSMFTHEMKHFHDLLITPYGSVLMRQYTRGAILSLPCLQELLLHRKKIVLPLSDWVSDSELFHDIYAIDPPSKNLSELNEVFKTMTQKLHFFNKGSLSLPSSLKYLNAGSILEGLAILNQELFIKKEFGDDKLKYFRQGFKTQTAYARYYTALEFIQTFLDQTLSYEVISYLLFSSLCGNFQDPNPNHLRYPKDILVSMLMWLKEKNINLNKFSCFDDIVDVIDDFFNEELGNDVQGMIIQAAKTNKKFEDVMLEDIKRFENLTFGTKAMEQVLRVFNNFYQIQASFGNNVCVNPQWYFSETYLDNQLKLPSPVLFLESKIGLPIDENLEDLYYIQTESRIQLDDLPNEISSRFNLNNLADAEGVIRAAHILSPRKSLLTTKNLDKNIPWVFEVPEVDIQEWQKSYDLVGLSIRCLLEGKNANINEQLFQTFIMTFAHFGTEIFSTSGKYLTLELPDDLSSPVIDPYLREMFSDEKFKDLIKLIRESKEN